MSANRLYFIGAGPGAPDLITIRGLEALQKSKSVFLAESYQESFRDLLIDKKLYIPFDYFFDEIIDLTKKLLKDGDVSFLVPGDFTLFSPFQSIVSHFGDECMVIPGVGSLNAASSILKKTLDLPRVSGSIIITSPKRISKTEFTDELSELIRRDSTLVLFMNNMPAKELKAQLIKEYPPTTPVAVVHKISSPGEKVVITTVERLPDDIDDAEFFNIGEVKPCASIVIVGDVIGAAGNPEFWDYRKINFWSKPSVDGF
jgi:precorrin-4/cobalt-precorrin-4 C11-methyltransferase